MTHSEFDWTPSARVNLITGVNGAGKSSILQAIVIGLGNMKAIEGSAFTLLVLEFYNPVEFDFFYCSYRTKN